MPDSPYRKNAETLVDHFSIMVDRAQQKAFPPLRKRSSLSPDIKVQAWWQRFVNLVASPFSPDINNPAGPFLLISGFIGLLALNMSFAYRLLTGTRISSGQTTITSGQLVFSIFIIVTTFATIPTTYIYSWWLFRSKRHKHFIRVLVILSYGIWSILISSGIYGWIANTSTITYTLSMTMMQRTILYIFLLFFPLVTFSYIGSFNLLLWISLVFLGGGKYFLSIHTPIHKEDILDLVFDSSGKTGNNKANWRLIDLPLKQIQSLRAWALANRESSDKRLLPVAVVFAFLSLFTNIDQVNAFIVSAFKWCWNSISFISGNNFTLTAFRDYLATIVVCAISTLFLRSLVDLFSNIVVQSLIIEACMVAEYGRTEETPDTPSATAPTEKQRGGRFFWRR